MSQNQILEKVKKLLLKAESAKQIGSLEEAEAFMAKVNELMMEYNISEHELRMAAAKDQNEHANWLYGESFSYYEPQAGARWGHDLIKMLCRHNLVGVVFEARGNKCRVYGLIENVESTVWLFNFLHTRLIEMAKQSRKNLDRGTRDSMCRHTYLKNYLMGAIDGIDEKIKKQVEESKLKDAMYALVVTNREVLRRYIDKVEPGNYYRRNAGINVGTGYHEGLKDGKGMSFGGRLSNAAQSIEKKMLK